MARSLKKGPFVDHHLQAKADKAVQKAQAKAAGGGKAAKNMPKGAAKGGAKSTGR